MGRTGWPPRFDRGWARWLPWAVLAVALVVALIIGSGSRSGPETVGQRVANISQDVRCPSCSGLSVEESNAPTAVAIRQLITARVQAGHSDASIEAELERSYGSGILLRPPASGVAAVVWVVPLVAATGAVVTLVVIFRRRRMGTGPAPPVSEEDRALVEQALR